MIETDVFDLAATAKLAVAAGIETLKVYHSDYAVQAKEDTSPLTDADLASHEILTKGLDSRFPILSEEGAKLPYSERSKWNRYWLIDPLDGTKEFIKRNGEFTINVALIEKGVPVAGFVYAPVPDLLYIGVSTFGAWLYEGVSENLENFSEITGPYEQAKRPVQVVASRSHLNEETESYISRVREFFGEVDFASSGSSLKLCRVAEGKADIYPRFAPTMEWDTAAADAVCRAAGCYVVNGEDKKPLRYNKENLLNPWFLAGKNPAFIDLI